MVGTTSVEVVGSARHPSGSWSPPGFPRWLAGKFDEAGLHGPFKAISIPDVDTTSGPKEDRVWGVRVDNPGDRDYALIRCKMPRRAMHGTFTYRVYSTDSNGPSPAQIIELLNRLDAVVTGKALEVDETEEIEHTEQEQVLPPNSEEAEHDAAMEALLRFSDQDGLVLYEIIRGMTTKSRLVLTEGQVKGAARRALGEILGSPSRVTNEGVRDAVARVKERDLCRVDGHYSLTSCAFGTISQMLGRRPNDGESRACLEWMHRFLASGPYQDLKEASDKVREEIEGHRLEVDRLDHEIEGIEGEIETLRARIESLKTQRTGETTAMEGARLILNECEAILDGLDLERSILVIEEVLTSPEGG